MTRFQPGEIVSVTIIGVRIAEPGVHSGRSDTYSTDTSIVDEHGTEYSLPPQAKIERLAPEVQTGDLWRDQSNYLITRRWQ